MRNNKYTHRARFFQFVQQIHFSNWMIFLSLILIFLMGFHQIEDLDIGFILKGGKSIIETNAFPRHDAYTYTVNGKNEYINSHWLFQIIAFLIYSQSGYYGLSLFQAILFLCIFVVVVRIGNGQPLTSFLLLPAAIAMHFRVACRPEMFSYLFFVLMLLILARYLKKRNGLVWFLIPMQLVWVNSHGLSIIGVFFQWACWFSDCMSRKKADKRMLFVAVLSSCCLLINPYGLKGALFPFYLFTRLQGGHIMKEQISEFQSLSHVVSTQFSETVPIGLTLLKTGLVFLLIFFVLFLLLLIRRKLSLFEVVLVLVGLVLVAMGIRNLPFFLLAMLSILVQHESFPGFNPEKYRLVAIIVLIVFASSVFNSNIYAIDRNSTLTGGGISRSHFPVRIGEWLNKVHYKGKVMNDLNSGSWIEWATECKVYIDGRLEVMQEAHFTDYLRIDSETGLESVLERYDHKVLVFDFIANPGWERQINRLVNWRIAMVDGKYCLALRKDFHSEKTMINHKEWKEVHGDMTDLRDSVFNREVSRMQIASKFLLSNYSANHYDLVYKGVFWFRQSQFQLAERYLLQSALKTNLVFPEIYLNLATLYYSTHRYDLAAIAYKKYAELKGSNSLINDKISRCEKLASGKSYIHW